MRGNTLLTFFCIFSHSIIFMFDLFTNFYNFSNFTQDIFKVVHITPLWTVIKSFAGFWCFSWASMIFLVIFPGQTCMFLVTFFSQVWFSDQTNLSTSKKKHLNSISKSQTKKPDCQGIHIRTLTRSEISSSVRTTRF